MTTSGNTNFEQTRNEIIESSLRKCRVLSEGEAPTAEMILNGTQELNQLLKFWQAQGYHLWKTPEAYIFLEKGKDVYKLGETGDLASENVTKTHVIYEAYQGTNQIYIKNVPNAGDYIGIELCCGNLWFTTVASVSDNMVVLADLLPRHVKHKAKIYFFTNKISRPLKILQAKRERLNGQSIPLNNLEREQFFKLVNHNGGEVLNYNYVPTLINGTFSVWPKPMKTDMYLKIIYEQAFDVFDSSKDTPDLSPEWTEPLKWGLAYRLSANYGLELQEREWLRAQAELSLEEAKRFDAEEGSFYIQPAQYGGAF